MTTPAGFLFLMNSARQHQTHGLCHSPVKMLLINIAVHAKRICWIWSINTGLQLWMVQHTCYSNGPQGAAWPQPQHSLKGQQEPCPPAAFLPFCCLPEVSCLALLVAALSTARPCSLCLDPSSWPRLSDRWCPLTLVGRWVCLPSSASCQTGEDGSAFPAWPAASGFWTNAVSPCMHGQGQSNESMLGCRL